MRLRIGSFTMARLIASCYGIIREARRRRRLRRSWRIWRRNNRRFTVRFWSQSDLMTLAVRFNARTGDKSHSPSRQRRLKGAVELCDLMVQPSLTRRYDELRRYRALKRTAKVKSRYAAGEMPSASRAEICVMTRLYSVARIRGLG